MYKATHSYKAQQEHILSFSAGDSMCVLEKSSDSWWLASNSNGQVGYVPATYIAQTSQGDDDIVLQSVNTAISETIASAKGGSFTPQQQALLKKLVAHKDSLIDQSKQRQTSTKRRAPPPPPPSAKDDHIPEAKHAPLPDQPTSESHAAPPIPKRLQSLEATPECAIPAEGSPPTSVDIKGQVPSDLGLELVQSLRNTLNINETRSRESLCAMLGILKNRIPSFDVLFQEILETLPPENKDDDSYNLALALENLKEIKDDAQQRNWAIEDDEDKIMGILNEILKEMTTIENASSIRVLSHDQHLALHTLVDYHQMESRVSLRLATLQIFGAVCSLETSMVSALLATVLPLELALDIMNHTQDSHRTCYSALVMTMLFSTAEPIPVSHYGRLNASFVGYLVQYVEGELDAMEQDEQVVEMFINVILSFNLHFVVPSENSVMEVIAERGTCTLLSEKIMMLFNRGDDPVVMEEHWQQSSKGRPPPSVLKFLQDIFSQRSTSTFLYTNDMNVLIDIVTRNLTDLSSGDNLRTEYLDLLLNVLTNTDYNESRHRAADLSQSLNRILEEEPQGDESQIQQLSFDKQIVDKIMSNFGHLFI